MVPSQAADANPSTRAVPATATKRATATKSVAKPAAKKAAPATKAAAKKAAPATKAAPAAKAAPVKKAAPAAAKAPAKKAAPATKAPAKKAAPAAAKAPAKKAAPATKAPAKKAAPAASKAPAKKAAPATKAPATKTPAKKATASTLAAAAAAETTEPTEPTEPIDTAVPTTGAASGATQDVPAGAEPAADAAEEVAEDEGEETGSEFTWDEEESEALRQARKDAEMTASADSVRAYLKQIGKVALLNAEEEVDLAKRIEAGLYASHKLADAASAGVIRAIALRYFNPIGADPALRTGLQNPAPTHALGKMISAHAAGEPFTVTGVDWPTRDGSGLRDYIHVWDLARAHVAVLERFAAALRGHQDDAVVLGFGLLDLLRQQQRGEIARHLEQAVGQ